MGSKSTNEVSTKYAMYEVLCVTIVEILTSETVQRNGVCGCGDGVTHRSEQLLVR